MRKLKQKIKDLVMWLLVGFAVYLGMGLAAILLDKIMELI